MIAIVIIIIINNGEVTLCVESAQRISIPRRSIFQDYHSNWGKACGLRKWVLKTAFSHVIMTWLKVWRVELAYLVKPQLCQREDQNSDSHLPQMSRVWWPVSIRQVLGDRDRRILEVHREASSWKQQICWESLFPIVRVSGTKEIAHQIKVCVAKPSRLNSILGHTL